MWTTETEPVENGLRFLPGRDSAPISRGEFFSLLAEHAEYPTWYNNLLSRSGTSAFFWEFPPLTTGTLDAPVEFVVLPAPQLDSMRPDPEAFREHFDTVSSGSIAQFSNLGGDACLLAPLPRKDPAIYTHLATFVRGADEPQAREFWRRSGVAVLERCGDKPLWLSTTGLGIGWLHIRLDSHPKYYQHGPYRRFPASGIRQC